MCQQAEKQYLQWTLRWASDTSSLIYWSKRISL
jgi:hypothetical protein